MKWINTIVMLAAMSISACTQQPQTTSAQAAPHQNTPDSAATSASASTPGTAEKVVFMSARDLWAEFHRDPAAARAKYDDLRVGISGVVMVSKRTSSGSAFAEITAGNGTESDMGHNYVFLVPNEHWAEAISTLQIGEVAVAICSPEEIMKNDEGGEMLLTADCSDVVTGFGKSGVSPFAH